MGIVCRDHDVVITDSADDVAHEIFLHVDRNKALAKKIVAGLPAQRLVGVVFAQLPPFIESIKRPGKPAAVAFEESHFQFREAFQNAAGTEASHRKYQLNGIAKRVDQHRFVSMAFEAMYDLIGIRIGRRVKAYRHAELFRFAPHRVVVTVMNMTAIDRLRHEAQANGAKLLNRAARLIDGEIDIMQGDQGRWSKPLRIGLAKIRHPVIPSAAEVVGILWLKAVVAVQWKRTK